MLCRFPPVIIEKDILRKRFRLPKSNIYYNSSNFTERMKGTECRINGIVDSL